MTFLTFVKNVQNGYKLQRTVIDKMWAQCLKNLPCVIRPNFPSVFVHLGDRVTKHTLKINVVDVAEISSTLLAPA